MTTELKKRSLLVSWNSPGVLIARLVDRRKVLGISQKEVAFRLGIDPANLCCYEKGKINPSLDFFVRWCKALGFEVELNPVTIYDLS